MMLVSVAIVGVIVSSLALCEAKLQENDIQEDNDEDLVLRSKKSPVHFAHLKHSDDSDRLKSEYISLVKTFKENYPNVDSDELHSQEKKTNNESNYGLNYNAEINKKFDELSKEENSDEPLRVERDYYIDSDLLQPGSWQYFYNDINPSIELMPMYRTAFGAAGIQDTKAEDAPTLQEDPSKQQQQQQQQQQQGIVSPVSPVAPAQALIEPFKHKGIIHAHPIKIAHPIKLIHADKIKPVALHDNKKHEVELALITKKIAAALEVLKKKKLIIDAEIKSKIEAAAAAALVLHKKKEIAGAGHVLVHDHHHHPHHHIKTEADVPSFYAYGQESPYGVPTFYSYPEQPNYYYPNSLYPAYPQEYAQTDNGLYFDRMGYLPPAYFSYPEASYVEQSEYYPLSSYIYPQTSPYY